MPNLPSVSVIIPTYNRLHFMEQMLNCCKKQTLKDIEFIIIDDGSTDGTYAYLQAETESDDRFKIFKVNKNSGPYACRNIGLKQANGEYIGFFDCDDEIPEDYFEKLYYSAIKSKADIVYTTFNKQKHRIKKIRNLTDKFEVLSNGALWDKIFKASFLRKYHLTFSEKWYTADTFFIISAFYYASKIKLLDEPTYSYNLQEDSIGMDPSKKDKRQKDILNVLREILSFAEEKNISSKERLALKYFCNRSLNRYNDDIEFTNQFNKILNIKNDIAERKDSFMISALKLQKMTHLISDEKYQEKYNIALIESSPLFDKKWYLAKYVDVKKRKMRAARHYYRFGFKEGRNPSPSFDNNDYLFRYPDVAASGMNPLLHYITKGSKEGYTYTYARNTAVSGSENSLWDKIRYALEYPIRVKEEYDRLTAEIKALENMK